MRVLVVPVHVLRTAGGNVVNTAFGLLLSKYLLGFELHLVPVVCLSGDGNRLGYRMNIERFEVYRTQVPSRFYPLQVDLFDPAI